MKIDRSSSDFKDASNPKPSMPATISKVAKLLNSYTRPLENEREWSREEPDTSLSNKIATIAKLLRSPD